MDLYSNTIEEGDFLLNGFGKASYNCVICVT